MKKFTLFILIIVANSAFCLNAMHQREPQVSPETQALLKFAEAKQLCDNDAFYKKNKKPLNQELRSYKNTLEWYQNSWLPRLDTFLLGSSQLIIGTLCAYKAYKKYRGENFSSLDFCLFTSGAATFLHKEYTHCKNVFMWHSIMSKKVTSAKDALTILKNK